MKKGSKTLRDTLIAIGIIAAVIAIVAFVVYGIVAANNVAPSMSDIMATVSSVSVQIVVIVIALAIIVVGIGISANMKSSMKVMVRGQSVIAGLLIIVLAANWICYGPLNGLISMTFADSIALSDESVAEGLAFNEILCDEGIVLLKNEGNALPLNGTANLNVFGWGSVDSVHGGSGSGAGTGDNRVTLVKGLENAGFTVNSDLVDFYTSYNSTRPLGSGVGATNITLPEPSVDSYSSDLIAGAKAFSDTALVVLCRVGGEDLDLPSDVASMVSNGKVEYNTTDTGMAHDGDFTAGMHYLELSNTERDMVDMVCSEFSNVVVIVNSANPLELGFLEEYSSIKAALLVPAPGANGFNSMGKILSGAVNPSGHTADTFVYDLTDTPTFNNFGHFEYDNVDEFLVNPAGTKGPGTGVTFVNYVEGIYVGYKFWETAVDDGFINYDDKVQFPFGYGLSYTSFTQEITGFQDSSGTVTMDVKVTNTGSIPGKDVVEVYFNPPYYNGGIEKASVNLLDLGKTTLLEPGASDTLSFTFTYDDLASYDTYGNGCYVAEHGDYEISIRSDSHTILEARTLTISGDRIYNDKNDGPRDSDGIAAENVFTYAEGDVTYLSRADSFANYQEATAAPAENAYTMAQPVKDTFINALTWLPEDHDNPEDVMPTMGAKNGLTFYEMKGVNYDDPQWDKLLDQMTFEEMVTLVGVGAYQTAAISSIGLPSSVQSDGPGGLTTGMAANVGSGTDFSCENMLAQTWNKDLAYERGSMFGKQANELHVTGWYGPGTNTHRSAFGGRNFEYYSEDGVLAGYMCAGEVQGARDNGLLAYMKHFALNDQETNRVRQICTWANEQSIREIYLKSYELGAKEGGANAVMSSFNFIGNRWAGGYDGLLQTILRDEWGLVGVVVSDWWLVSGGYMDANLATRSGGDQMLSPTGQGSATVTDTSPTATIALRNACHNILYGLTQTNMIDWEVSTPTWNKLIIGSDVVLGIILLTAEFLIIRKFKKSSKETA